MRDQRSNVPPRLTKAARIWLGARLAVLLALIAAYKVESDLLAPIRIYPYWAWAFLVLFVSVPIRLKRSGKSFLLVLALTLTGSLIASEEPYFLLASARPQIPKQTRLRIVSINCAGGSTLPASEALELEPDVLLLQESPGTSPVQDLLASHPGYQAVTGADGTVIVKGTIDQSTVHTSINATTVEATVKGMAYQITSLRLRPPIFRIDYYNPEAWQSISRNLTERKAEFVELVSDLKRQNKRSLPTIVGGDFNAPATVTHELNPGNDLALLGGAGWNSSTINQFPLVRIDRVYTSFLPPAARTWSIRSQSSDHRIVVCDIQLAQN